MLVFFYAKILQLHLEQMKSTDMSEEKKEFICRDVLPRHLIRDMLAYGHQRIDLFKASFSSDEVLTDAYGRGETSQTRDDLEDELALIVYIV